VVRWHDRDFDDHAKELARRDQERQTNVMLRMTKWIAAMTVVMTVATIVNVVLFALS